MIFSTTLEMKDTLTIGRKLPGSVGSIPSRLMTGIRMDLFWALARLLSRWIDCKLLLGVAAICPGALAGGTYICAYITETDWGLNTYICAFITETDWGLNSEPPSESAHGFNLCSYALSLDKHRLWK